MKKLSDFQEGYFSDLDVERQDRAIAAKKDAKKKKDSDYKKKTSEAPRSLSRMESTAAYSDTMKKQADAKKKAAISSSDKDKLGKLADLMKRANESVNEASYRDRRMAQAQSAIDKATARHAKGAEEIRKRRAEREAQKAVKENWAAKAMAGKSPLKKEYQPSKDSKDDHAKRMKKKMYGNMMGGLKKEETDYCDCGCDCGKKICESCGKPHMKKEQALMSFQEVAGQRGRPKRGEAGESDQHIIMQLRSAQDLGGQKEVKFSNQKSAKVHPKHIDKILKAHDSLSHPRDKRKLRVAIGRSHEHLQRVANALK